MTHVLRWAIAAGLVWLAYHASFVVGAMILAWPLSMIGDLVGLQVQSLLGAWIAAVTVAVGYAAAPSNKLTASLCILAVGCVWAWYEIDPPYTFMEPVFDERNPDSAYRTWESYEPIYVTYAGGILAFATAVVVARRRRADA